MLRALARLGLLLLAPMACRATSTPLPANDDPSPPLTAVVRPPPPVTAPPDAFTELTLTLPAWLNARLEDAHAAGLALGVSHRGRRFVFASGWADVGEERALKETDSFRWASIGKVLTAVAILQLEAAGRLSLDDEVQVHVPSFPRKRWPLTIRALLSHLSGLPNYVDCRRECHITEQLDTEASLDIFAAFELRAKPGTEFIYTSYGFNLLAAIVESASGLSFEAYLQRNVFDPANMDGALVERAHPAPESNWVEGYRPQGARLVPSESINISSRFGGGGLRGSVVDLLDFGESLQGHRLLDAERTSEMQRDRTTVSGEPIRYGYGTAAYPRFGTWVSGHAGGQPETSSLLLMYPSDDLIIALLRNVEDDRALLFEIAGHIADQLLNQGRPRRGIQGGGVPSHAVATAMLGTYSHGVARTRMWPTSTSTPADAWSTLESVLADALLDGAATDLMERVERGSWGADGGPFAAAGRAMLEAIHRNEPELELSALARAGPVSFYRLYLEACASGHCPADRRFSPAVEESLQTYVDTYATPTGLARAIGPNTSTVALVSDLAVLQTQPLRLDVSSELADEAIRSARAGHPARTRVILDMMTTTFPMAIRTHLATAEAECLLDAAGSESRDPATEALVLAAAHHDAEDRMKTWRLKFDGIRLEREGRPDAAVCWLAAAAEAKRTDRTLWLAYARRADRLDQPRRALVAYRRARALGLLGRSDRQRVKELKQALR